MTLLVSGQFNVNNHAHLIRGTKESYSLVLPLLFSRRFNPLFDKAGSWSLQTNEKYPGRNSLRLPPPPEQEAIAEALSDADALIESLEQLIAKKRQIKQGAMQELLTGKKRLPGFAN